MENVLKDAKLDGKKNVEVAMKKMINMINV